MIGSILPVKPRIVSVIVAALVGAASFRSATADPAPSPTPNPTIPAQAVNLSTRAEVETGDQVSIAGFIIEGTSPKRIVLRAIGPSLASFGIANALPDPVLELHASDQTLIASNDNWQDNINFIDVQKNGLAPPNALESALVLHLPAGAYTAVESGADGGTGIGLVEVYTLQ